MLYMLAIVYPLYCGLMAYLNSIGASCRPHSPYFSTLQMTELLMAQMRRSNHWRTEFAAVVGRPGLDTKRLLKTTGSA